MGRKILMTLIITVMIFALNVKVQAADISENGGKVTVPVTYSVNNTSFIISVPTVIKADTVETSFEITAKEVNLRPEEYIEVFLTEGCDENGRISLKRKGSEDYLVTTASVGGKNISENNYRVGYFKDGESATRNLDGAVTLSGLNVTRETRSGDYSAGICFVVELRDDLNE